LVAIDGRPASEFRLGRIRELLQAMRTRRLTFQRSSMRITVRLTPRRRI
jgi:hypothetical protein